MKRKEIYPTKTSMSLYYKPDRTTKPSTIALYTLFTLVVMLGLCKWLVYDVWMEKVEAERALAAAQEEFNDVMLQLADYNEVRQRYFRYAATDEERATLDRLEVLAMLEEAAGSAWMDTISISEDTVTTQLSNVTLAQIAEIVQNLEESPLVASIVVHTAATSGEYGEFTNWWGETYTVGDDWDLVQANITIELQNPETEQTEQTEEVTEE